MTNDLESQAKKELRKRVLESFQPHYLTLISIIQSVVLAFLLFTVHSIVEQSKGFWEFATKVESLRSVVTFLLLLTVWDEYRQAASVHRWAPRWVDSLLPFLIGVVEYVAVTCLEEPTEWLWSLSSLSVVGCLAYCHTWHRADYERRISRKANNDGGQCERYILPIAMEFLSPRRSTLACLCLAVFLFILACVSSINGPIGWWLEILSLLAIGVFVYLQLGSYNSLMRALDNHRDSPNHGRSNGETGD